MYVGKEFTFEASHQIDGHFGKCARLHGHSWKLFVGCEGAIDPITGVVIDYYHVKEAVQPIIDDLDHHHLGYGFPDQLRTSQPLISDVPWIPFGFKPTSENLLLLLADRITEISSLPWSDLTIKETCTSSATLMRSEYNRMKGGNPYGKQKGHEEGSQEGKEVPTQERQQKAGKDVEAELRITDDDIPF
jgi:6-pyruvoyltetrahydropterin/6-carboxytetrahydropterin synthase